MAPQLSLHFAMILRRVHLPFDCLRVHARSLRVLVHATTETPGANGGSDGAGGLRGGRGGFVGGGGRAGGGEGFGGFVGGGGAPGGSGALGGVGGGAGGGLPFWQITKSDDGQ